MLSPVSTRQKSQRFVDTETTQNVHLEFSRGLSYVFCVLAAMSQYDKPELKSTEQPSSVGAVSGD